MAWMVFLLYGLFFAIPLSKTLAEFDKGSRVDVLRDTAKSLGIYLYLFAKWGLVFLGLNFLFIVLTPPYPAETLSLSMDTKTWLDDAWHQALTASKVIGIGIGFALILGVIAAKIRGAYLRRRGKEHKTLTSGYVRRFLSRYNISESLTDQHGLEVFLSELFDPDYYGRIDFDNVVEDALLDRYTPTSRGSDDDTRRRRRRIYEYSARARKRPIRVGIAVANLKTGGLEVVPGDQPVVDALLAATAVSPLFPPKKIGDTLFVDGVNVANVPTRALLQMLRNRLNSKSKILHIYSVAPFPFSQKILNPEGKPPILNLVDIAVRALQLRRLRDAAMERRLTELFTKVIPSEHPKTGKPMFELRLDEKDAFYRAWVTPIELESPVSLNARILGAPKEKRRASVAETIADGCRCALQVMIRSSVAGASSDSIVSCRQAVNQHKLKLVDEKSLPRSIVDTALPGSKGSKGPGLAEICAHCALNRKTDAPSIQSLRLQRWAEVGPSWPHELELEEPELDTNQRFCRRKQRTASRVDTQSPEDAAPTKSLLFSGGVFRGVFQVGVLNALNELELKPDHIAGASIGAITSAMAARTFDLPEPLRKKHIARLAAVYLAVDQMILTDRFADFVRNLTVRAAATRFSIRDADSLFRQYDRPGSLEFSRSARRVIAGLERLFYVSPYELNELTRLVRGRDMKNLADRLKELTQQWLDKMEVGQEMLGAEPLELLIQQFVLDAKDQRHANHVPFEAFENGAVQLLASVTDLTHGSLELLGTKIMDQAVEDQRLVEGLLASSAFPAVFRPRWSWDLIAGATRESQYIDGGVIDNLPVNAVVRFLMNSSAPDWNGTRIAARPRHPHLLIAASLERDPREIAFEHKTWLDVHRRARQLGYNTKVDIYEQAENNIQRVYDKLLDDADLDPRGINSMLDPLNVRFITIKPKWLCGTFAFHPMLGFRRERQAASIAHGCAATLLRFSAVEPAHAEAWGVSRGSRPEFTGPLKPGESPSFDEPIRRWQGIVAESENDGGHYDRREVRHWCWLRPGIDCPFSKRQLNITANGGEKNRPALGVRTVSELREIHKFCCTASTHSASGLHLR